MNDHLHFVQGVAWDPLNQFVASMSSDQSCHVYKRSCASQNRSTFTKGEQESLKYLLFDYRFLTKCRVVPQHLWDAFANTFNDLSPQDEDVVMEDVEEHQAQPEGEQAGDEKDKETEKKQARKMFLNENANTYVPFALIWLLTSTASLDALIGLLMATCYLLHAALLERVGLFSFHY